MKYKHFVKWCNERAADGQWSLDIVRECLTIIETMKHISFWKRKKIWSEISDDVEKNIVIPVNNEIKRRKENNNV